jgi:hypothetical protein
VLALDYVARQVLVLAALGVKAPEKNPVFATLRDEVRKALLV